MFNLFKKQKKVEKEDVLQFAKRIALITNLYTRGGMDKELYEENLLFFVNCFLIKYQ